MKTIKLVLLFSLFYSIMPACFAVISPEIEVPALSRDQLEEGFDETQDLPDELQGLTLSNELDQTSPKLEKTQPQSLWKRTKKLARKYPKTVLFSSAALIATAILINQRLNAQAPGTPDVTEPITSANQSGSNTLPPGSNSTPGTNATPPQNPPANPQPQTQSQTSLPQQGQDSTLGSGTTQTGPTVQQSSTPQPQTPNVVQQHATSTPASNTQTATLSAEEIQQIKSNIKNFPIQPGSFWDSYIMHGRSHLASKIALALNYIIKDAEDAQMKVSQWTKSDKRKVEIEKVEKNTQGLRKNDADILPEIPGNLEIGGFDDVIVVNRITDESPLKKSYPDAKLCYFDGFTKADDKTSRWKIFLSLPSDFKPTGGMRYVYLKTPNNLPSSYRILIGQAKDDKNNSAYFAASYPEFVQSFQIKDYETMVETDLNISAPNDSTGNTTSHASPSLTDSDWSGTMTHWNTRGVETLFSKPQSGKKMYMPISEERRTKVLADTENLKLGKDNIMSNAKTTSAQNITGPSAKIMSGCENLAIPVFEEDRGRCFVAQSKEDPSVYYRVYQTLPDGFTPQPRAILLNVSSTCNKHYLRAGDANPELNQYDLKAGLAKGGLNNKEYVLYATERPIYVPPEPKS